MVFHIASFGLVVKALEAETKNPPPGRVSLIKQALENPPLF